MDPHLESCPSAVEVAMLRRISGLGADVGKRGLFLKEEGLGLRFLVSLFLRVAFIPARRL